MGDASGSDRGGYPVLPLPADDVDDADDVGEGAAAAAA